ncbi:GATOR complex protein Iml1-like isoform X2 [Dreissena polymorpha]|nr:GATOR complex protein Iml1-like isoform X2 [Dreissena polymorpha]
MTLKLCVHKKVPSNKQLCEEILINPKDIPNAIVGDVVEIYHPEEEFSTCTFIDSRLLLQIRILPEDYQPKDTVVSIEQTIATAFQLKAYKNVIVSKVDKDNVSVDLAEVLFKDQYYSRSDMNRLRESMVNTCVYLNKKMEFCEMRAQVNELWSRGEKVTCGFISKDTRVVFRSSTSVVHIFIQMSSEMWEFDINGDLYFEKAVNGFLTDLYAKWKEQNCLHDVTIVMFSRTFYDAQTRDEFPQYMQECVQQDYAGRFYEDFYRIVVQNERYEEWTGTIKQLRKIFFEYRTRVLNYHRRPGHRVPDARNSTATEGNFLETLNMTLNLFEKYYYDRNFDRTGKVAVVITPGAGVFEVDRELTNITKQRTIDCGVGSDLVCMGEQPLHAAPLFKFHSRTQGMMLEVGDDYNVPHWMNHSFYSSKNQIQFYSNKTFVPRIKIPPEIFEKQEKKEAPPEQEIPYNTEEDNFPIVDYDEYDAQVWKLPKTVNSISYGKKNRSYHQSRAERFSSQSRPPQTFVEARLMHSARTRTISDNISCLPVEKKPEVDVMQAISFPSSSSTGDDLSTSVGCYPVHGRGHLDSSDEHVLGARQVAGSAESSVSHMKYLHNTRRHRALINPFQPSKMQFKMTSNRRRWIHAFPTDPHGVAVQTHHVQTYSYHDNTEEEFELCDLTEETIQAAHQAVKARNKKRACRGLGDNSDLSNVEEGAVSRVSQSHDLGRSLYGGSFKDPKHQRSFMWGPTGEQEWTAELSTGTDWRPLDNTDMSPTESRLIKPILKADLENSQNFCAGISVDWKSLIMPASLPITTDYFPDPVSLNNEYVESMYQLLPDSNSLYYSNPPESDDEKYYRKKPLSAKQVFCEMISQRLSQGFQLIKMMRNTGSSLTLVANTSQRVVPGSSPQVSHMSGLKRCRPREETAEEVYLSIGRIFHKLSRTGSEITVTRYRPRHQNAQLSYNYRYRFQAPDSFNYDVSWSEFHNEKLENYNWNYLDQYICTQGEGDFGLMDSLKFWRSRFFILPCNNPATKKISEGHQRCDIYEEKTSSELKQLIIGFTRYLEILNKMKRTAVTRQTNCIHKEFLDKNPGGIPMPDTRPDEEVLCMTSPSDKVVRWMLDDVCGIPMLPKQLGLPHKCFISAEIVDWFYYHVKGVKSVKHVMNLLQRLLDDGYIVHSSGNPDHKVLYGFYLYTFKDPKSKNDPASSFNTLFQNDWCEVVFVDTIKEVGPSYVSFSLDTMEGDVPGPSGPTDDWRLQTGLNIWGQTWAQQSATLLHKYVNVDVDPQCKSDRPEWATARYHAYYSPLCAFELQVQWMVATGQILGDLIYNWARKAASCGFHLLPVPCDPFALPSAIDSDPLRGPIFIPLKVAAIDQHDSIFVEYDKSTREQKLLQFQEAIIKRFGFIESSVRVLANRNTKSSQGAEDYHQYVHCTGGMFIIIEDTNLAKANHQPIIETRPIGVKPVIESQPINAKKRENNSSLGNLPPSRNMKSSVSYGTLGKKSFSELRKDYIARQTSQLDCQNVEWEIEIGFLWSWNFMLSRRWRSGNTGDETFQDNVLRDFRAFCSNEDDRLYEFWMEYKAQNII